MALTVAERLHIYNLGTQLDYPFAKEPTMAYSEAELQAAAREGAVALRDVAKLVRSESFTMTADRMENAAARLERALPPPEPTLDELRAAVVEASLAKRVQDRGESWRGTPSTDWQAAVDALEARIEKERGDASE